MKNRAKGQFQNINSIVDFKALYKEKSRLGYGAWGEVNAYVHKKTDVFCAGKLINKKFIEKKGAMAIENLKKELQTLDEIDHPNIVRIIQLLDGKKFFYIMMEHIDGGNLKEVIAKNKGFKQEISRRIIRQILEALKYLHQVKKIMHRDLKPENVLIYDFKEGEHIQIKLVDFGFASDMT